VARAAADEANVAALAFRISPRFYQTYTFLLLCVMLALLAAWGFNRLRANQIERRYALILGERNRIAREVHDTLAQGFVGVSTQLEVVSELITRAPETACKHLDIARDLARTSLDEARRAIVNLRSPALESHSLKTALADFARQLTEGADIECRITARGDDTALSDKIANSLLRVGREAIANAVRHAKAKRIAIELRCEPHRVCLRVRDDGCGFDPTVPRAKLVGGYGLTGMRERARELGGDFAVHSRPGAGTTVEVVIPIRSR
jgi:signal transduction histidine kinase